MQKRTLVKLIPAFILPLIVGVFASINSKMPTETYAAGYSKGPLPTTINLNDATEAQVRNYYSGLASLDSDERKGQNLLKNLKPILMNGQQYYAYDSDKAVWKYYEITDRDWYLSPANTTTYGTYDPETNTITNYSYGDSYSLTKNNPYLHLLYRNVGKKDGFTRAWDIHGSDKTNPNGIDREHVWPKSHGFDEVQTGARGDPHHLIAGDHIVNNNHSDISYGNVATHDSSTLINNSSFLSGNYKGVSKKFGGETTVFEPQDSDKGDIARACFYMVARYNNIAGTDNNISSANPNLTLSDSIVTATGTSTASQAYSIGILSDLLEWHRLDPVDEYEMHRNNLIYNNYGKNRNPFIDFPEWVDAIWGESQTAVNPNTDKIVEAIPFDPSKYQNPDKPVDPINPEDENTSKFVFSEQGYEDKEKVTSISIDDYTSASFTKYGSYSDATYYVNGDALRVYSGATISFTTTKDILSIEFVYGDSDGDNTITASNGTFDGSVWTNSDEQSSVDFALSVVSGNNRRLSSIIVTYDGPVVTDFNLVTQKDTYLFGEGGGLINPSFTATATLSDGTTREISVTSNSIDTYSVGEQEVKVTYGNIVKLYKFTVTNEGTNYENAEVLTKDGFAIKGTSYAGYTYMGLTKWYAHCFTTDNTIQLRSSDSTAGIIQKEPLEFESVSFEWNARTSDKNSIYIYGSNDVYSSTTDLYNVETQGTLLGEVPYGTNDFEITTPYDYIGIRSKSGAVYFDSITLIGENPLVLKQAKGYGSFFINETCEICSDNGLTDHFEELNTIWTTLSKEYKAMSSDVKNEFETSLDETILDARLRLGHILNRYHNLENFTSLEIKRISQIKLFDQLGLGDSPTLLIVLLTFVALGSCSIVIFVTRRKKSKM